MENNRGYRIANFETRKRVKKKKKNRFIFFTTTFKACYVIRFTRFLFVALLFDLFVMVRNFLPPFNICCLLPPPSCPEVHVSGHEIRNSTLSRSITIWCAKFQNLANIVTESGSTRHFSFNFKFTQNFQQRSRTRPL